MYLLVNIAVIFFCFMLLHLYYAHTLFPRLRDRTSQSFIQPELYNELFGFRLFGDNGIISLHHDPHLLLTMDSNIAGNFLSIDIENLQVRGTSAQVFYTNSSGRYFNEEDSLRFFLTNGRNIIPLPYSTYTYLRLDLAEQTFISMTVRNVTLSNYLQLPLAFYAILVILSILSIGITYIIFSKLTKGTLAAISHFFNKDLYV